MHLHLAPARSEAGSRDQLPGRSPSHWPDGARREGSAACSDRKRYCCKPSIFRTSFLCVPECLSTPLQKVVYQLSSGKVEAISWIGPLPGIERLLTMLQSSDKLSCEASKQYISEAPRPSMTVHGMSEGVRLQKRTEAAARLVHARLAIGPVPGDPAPPLSRAC